ncbi:MAG: AtpZ/AtpI family protein [Parcubacteria group bacterium]|jgi:F0F1-type ATP synthase assembly protein I
MKKNNKSSEAYDWSNGLNLFARLSGWIIFPILLAVVAGKWLDGRYNTEPWLMFLLMAVAFILSMTRMIVVALKEFKKFDSEKEEKKK